MTIESPSNSDLVEATDEPARHEASLDTDNLANGDGGGRASTPAAAKGRWKRSSHRWTRWLHVYTSMISLLLVLFFGLTGITLNHPEWTFGSEPTRSTETGQLPDDAIVDGEVEFLVVSEHVRNENDVKGQVKNFSEDGSAGTISFKNPGYIADVFFDLETGTYEVSKTQQGWLTVVNELHKGRDGDSNWRWVVDVSGGLLVAISLTGLVLQFFLRKRRISALSLAAAGTVVSVILMWLALN